ncbi:GGDEF domain-containing protein [Xanthobacteraceae bacterium Astr-EGSB]|uniref:GGDEF domain-containing protein n=1 Tax=Astrobacterium formosum TaxID=3069710 RepID=UPI0027B275D3|nr:GGDEF domain-containing protein [Xanthobacteraceae bacterium Astr-EGSB]
MLAQSTRIARCMNFETLTARLIALVFTLVSLGVAIPLLLVAGSMRHELEAQSSDHLKTIATYAAEDIGRQILTRRTLLENVASVIGATSDDMEAVQIARERLSEIMALFPSGVVILDASGEPLVARPARIWADGGGTISADMLAGDHGFTLGRPAISRISGIAEIAMAVPARDAEGRRRATVVGIVPLHSAGFLDVLYRTRVGRSGGLNLVSARDGIFLGASDEDNALKPVPPPGVHQQHDKAMRGIYTVAVDTRGGNMVEELAATVPVPNAPWFVVARIPTSELFAAVRRFDCTILIACALALVLVLVSATLILRRVLRPLRHSAELADHMVNGEASYAPLPVERADEVGHLTSAFNKLLASLVASRDEFEKLAHSDALTGLANRAAFDKAIVRYLSRARRHRACLTVLFFDLDGFKPINDRFGHDMGDAVLTAVAERLSRVARQEDFVARIGGDEFALLLDAADDTDEAFIELSSRLRHAIAEPILVDGRAFHVRLSIGHSCYPRDAETPEGLLAAADRAMYRDKQQQTMYERTSLIVDEIPLSPDERSTQVA